MWLRLLDQLAKPPDDVTRDQSSNPWLGDFLADGVKNNLLAVSRSTGKMERPYVRAGHNVPWFSRDEGEVFYLKLKLARGVYPCRQSFFNLKLCAYHLDKDWEVVPMSCVISIY